MKTILIVEDDRDLNDGIKLALENAENRFFQCYRLKDARLVMAAESVDLILLDLNFPDGFGLDFLKEIRAVSDVPVIIITAKNMESDIIIGLEAGANDYVTKPFSLMVLRERVSVQLRQNARKDSFQIDNMQFDFENMRFIVAGEQIELSKTEQRLLYLLLNNKGATLKRSYLIDNIWSGDTEYVDEHALTVAIKRLRSKIEADPSHPKYIKTVYGVGYSWGGAR